MRASARGITSPLIQISSFIAVTGPSGYLKAGDRRSFYNRRVRMVPPKTPPPPPEPPAPPAWDDALLRDPHAVADKRSRVRRMFAAIAPSYDLNNRLHSLWMDQRWRWKATELAELKPHDRVVDVACGTGDLTIAFADRLVWRDEADNPVGRVLGIDFTFEMLPLARRKWLYEGLMARGPTDPLTHPHVAPAVQFVNGDAQSLALAAAALTSSPSPSASATSRTRRRRCGSFIASCGRAGG